MSDDIYAEKLAWFKENEKPEAVLLVGDDPEKIRIVVAWTNMTVERAENLSRLNVGSGGDVWDWLWQNTRFSQEKMAAQSMEFSVGTSATRLEAGKNPRILEPNRISCV